MSKQLFEFSKYSPEELEIHVRQFREAIHERMTPLPYEKNTVQPYGGLYAYVHMVGRLPLLLLTNSYMSCLHHDVSVWINRAIEHTVYMDQRFKGEPMKAAICNHETDQIDREHRCEATDHTIRKLLDECDPRYASNPANVSLAALSALVCLQIALKELHPWIWNASKLLHIPYFPQTPLIDEPALLPLLEKEVIKHALAGHILTPVTTPGYVLTLIQIIAHQHYEAFIRHAA